MTSALDSPFPLTKMFRVWLTPTSMSATTSCLEKKSIEEGGSQLRILWLVRKKNRDWHLSPQNIVLLGFRFWQHAFNYRWIVELIFVLGVSPRERHEKILRLARCVYLLQDQLLQAAEFINQKIGFRFRFQTVHSHSSFRAAWHLTWRLKLIFSLLYSINCKVGSTWAL